VRSYVMQLDTVLDSGTPIPGYLVRTDIETDVLIDTGYRPGTFWEAMVSEDRLTLPGCLVLRFSEEGLCEEPRQAIPCGGCHGSRAMTRLVSVGHTIGHDRAIRRHDERGYFA
jgi:hypothetical protein